MKYLWKWSHLFYHFLRSPPLLICVSNGFLMKIIPCVLLIFSHTVKTDSSYSGCRTFLKDRVLFICTLLKPCKIWGWGLSYHFQRNYFPFCQEQKTKLQSVGFKTSPNCKQHWAQQSKGQCSSGADWINLSIPPS